MCSACRCVCVCLYSTQYIVHRTPLEWCVECGILTSCHSERNLDYIYRHTHTQLRDNLRHISSVFTVAHAVGAQRSKKSLFVRHRLESVANVCGICGCEQLVRQLRQYRQFESFARNGRVTPCVCALLTLLHTHVTLFSFGNNIYCSISIYFAHLDHCTQRYVCVLLLCHLALDQFTKRFMILQLCFSGLFLSMAGVRHSPL